MLFNILSELFAFFFLLVTELGGAQPDSGQQILEATTENLLPPI